MLINETAKKCKVTKKAVQYYVEQRLIFPEILENGYKNFSEDDVETLKKIVLYRKLGLSIDEIRCVLSNSNTLKSILYQKTLEVEREKLKRDLLKKLSDGEKIENLEEEINGINSSSIIIKRLMDLFPSFYGKFISLNFSRYLTGIIETDEQARAFDEIIEFFDNVPDIDIPKDLQEYLEAYLDKYSSKSDLYKINNMLQARDNAFQNIDAFVRDNKEILDKYREFKKSDEYKQSPAYRLMQIMKQFCESNGYYDIFIPAMRKLSPLYNEYYEQMLKANEKFITTYPEFVEKSDL